MEIIGQVLGGIVGGGVVTVLIKLLYKNMEKRIEGNEKEIRKVQENYLDRFDKVYNKIDILQHSVYKIDVSIARIETKLE